MVEGKLFKTKLCMLYQKGRCPRHSCTFAHGNAELRGHPGSFEGERSHRGADLRGRIERWHSPPRRHSPRRRDWEGREQRAHIGHAPSSSFDNRSQRKRKFEHREEFSGKARFSHPSEDREREKDGPLRSLTPVDTTMEELKQVKSDIEKLNAHKSQLQLYLEEKDKEVHALSYKLKKLEGQLNEEREESHRLASKIKKFVKAHNRHSRIEDELKRSQARLHKLGVQLGSHITSSAAQGEDWSMNVMSEEEGANQILNSGNGQDKTLSLSKRGVSIDLNSVPGPQSDAGLFNDERNEFEAVKSGRTSQKNTYSSPANREKVAEAVKRGDSGGKSKAIDRTPVKAPSTTIHSSKHQSSESGNPLPSTGMAAHADDEGADLMEAEKAAVIASALGEDNRRSEHNNITDMQLPPPPPLTDNNSKNQSTEDTFEEETVHVDVV